MAVVLESMQRDLLTLARSPPGTCDAGALQIPSCTQEYQRVLRGRGWRVGRTLKPVGHQSTNWIVRLVLMVATAELTSLGTTSPR